MKVTHSQYIIEMKYQVNNLCCDRGPKEYQPFEVVGSFSCFKSTLGSKDFEKGRNNRINQQHPRGKETFMLKLHNNQKIRFASEKEFQQSLDAERARLFENSTPEMSKDSDYPAKVELSIRKEFLIYLWLYCQNKLTIPYLLGQEAQKTMAEQVLHIKLEIAFGGGKYQSQENVSIWAADSETGLVVDEMLQEITAGINIIQLNMSHENFLKLGASLSLSQQLQEYGVRLLEVPSRKKLQYFVGGEISIKKLADQAKFLHQLEMQLCRLQNFKNCKCYQALFQVLCQQVDFCKFLKEFHISKAELVSSHSVAKVALEKESITFICQVKSPLKVSPWLFEQKVSQFITKNFLIFVIQNLRTEELKSCQKVFVKSVPMEQGERKYELCMRNKGKCSLEKWFQGLVEECGQLVVLKSLFTLSLEQFQVNACDWLPNALYVKLKD